MKKTIVYLLTLYLTFSGYAFTIPVDCSQYVQDEAVLITQVDKNSLLKEMVINQVLSLQHSLVIDVQQPLSKEKQKHGFLLIQTTPDYVRNLLEEKEGMIVAAYQAQSLVGYVILVAISEFKELYRHKSIGYLETECHVTAFNEILSKNGVGYIEQIAVKCEYAKKGIGRQLVNVCKELRPNGLVADVFVTPVTNTASLQFFSLLGFKAFGILHQRPTVKFPAAHQTQVFLWGQTL